DRAVGVHDPDRAQQSAAAIRSQRAILAAHDLGDGRLVERPLLDVTVTGVELDALALVEHEGLLDEPRRRRLLGRLEQLGELVARLRIVGRERTRAVDDLLLAGPVLALGAGKYGPLPTTRELALELGAGPEELGVLARQ